MTHIFLHFLIPLIISTVFFKKKWKKAYILMMLTMLVDLDHLLATPIYDAARCSIGFHPLHTIVPIGIYLVACFIPKTRYIGIGLIIHMILDSFDCQVTNSVWLT
jgi:hypothetical protein